MSGNIFIVFFSPFRKYFSIIRRKIESQSASTIANTFYLSFRFVELFFISLQFIFRLSVIRYVKHSISQAFSKFHMEIRYWGYSGCWCIWKVAVFILTLRVYFCMCFSTFKVDLDTHNILNYYRISIDEKLNKIVEPTKWENYFFNQCWSPRV